MTPAPRKTQHNTHTHPRFSSWGNSAQRCTMLTSVGCIPDTILMICAPTLESSVERNSSFFISVSLAFMGRVQCVQGFRALARSKVSDKEVRLPTYLTATFSPTSRNSFCGRKTRRRTLRPRVGAACARPSGIWPGANGQAMRSPPLLQKFLIVSACATSGFAPGNHRRCA